MSRSTSPMPRASLPIFTSEQAALIRQGKLTGCLISGVGIAPKPMSLRKLKRIVRVLDGDGVDTGETTVETSSVPLTVLSVSRTLHLSSLTDEHARKCGHTTPTALQDAWAAKNPDVLLVRIVEFACGDVRDRQPLMAYRAGETLNPARALDPDAPKVPIEDQERFTAAAHLKDQKRQQKEREATPVAERIADIERRAQQGDAEAQKHLFVIRQRVEKAEKSEAA